MSLGGSKNLMEGDYDGGILLLQHPTNDNMFLRQHKFKEDGLWKHERKDPEEFKGGGQRDVQFEWDYLPNPFTGRTQGNAIVGDLFGVKEPNMDILDRYLYRFVIHPRDPFGRWEDAVSITGIPDSGGLGFYKLIIAPGGKLMQYPVREPGDRGSKKHDWWSRKNMRRGLITNVEYPDIHLKSNNVSNDSPSDGARRLYVKDLQPGHFVSPEFEATDIADGARIYSEYTYFPAQDVNLNTLMKEGKNEGRDNSGLRSWAAGSDTYAFHADGATDEFNFYLRKHYNKDIYNTKDKKTTDPKKFYLKGDTSDTKRNLFPGTFELGDPSGLEDKMIQTIVLPVNEGLWSEEHSRVHNLKEDLLKLRVFRFLKAGDLDEKKKAISQFMKDGGDVATENDTRKGFMKDAGRYMCKTDDEYFSNIVPPDYPEGFDCGKLNSDSAKLKTYCTENNLKRIKNGLCTDSKLNNASVIGGIDEWVSDYCRVSENRINDPMCRMWAIESVQDVYSQCKEDEEYAKSNTCVSIVTTYENAKAEVDKRVATDSSVSTGSPEAWAFLTTKIDLDTSWAGPTQFKPKGYVLPSFSICINEGEIGNSKNSELNQACELNVSSDVTYNDTIVVPADGDNDGEGAAVSSTDSLEVNTGATGNGEGSSNVTVIKDGEEVSATASTPGSSSSAAPAAGEEGMSTMSMAISGVLFLMFIGMVCAVIGGIVLTMSR
tara:strand:+ start:394 stop:2535 length:2142 start_codon:yes stop_codon:yes gene_type:complete